MKSFFSPKSLFLEELYADAGHKEEAKKYLKMAETLFQEMGFVYWLNRTRKVLDKLKSN